MKIWFDTEFLEDGKTIDLISIGMIKEDGSKLYFENNEFEWKTATPWLIHNVKPYMKGDGYLRSRFGIAQEVIKFAGDKPEFWAYYADYDWVVLCQLFGTMMDLPKGWPMYCRDVKQLCDTVGNPKLPDQKSDEHNALNDAIWCREAYEFLQGKL